MHASRSCAERHGALLVRALALLAVLVAAKLTLLFSFGRHVVNTHWRVFSAEPGAFAIINFILLNCLLAGSLVLLGRRARAWPKATVAGLNVGLVLAGVAFAFLSAHRLNVNYLYPVMEGVLQPVDVWHYFSLDLFFAKPFVGGFVLAQALACWLLIRSGRGHWSLYTAAGLVVLFLAPRWRDWTPHDDELLVSNCFGGAALASLALSRGGLGWRAQVAPLLFLLPVWLLFRQTAYAAGIEWAYFGFMLCVCLALGVGAWAAGRASQAYPVVSHLLPFYFVTFLLLSNRFYPQASNYNHVMIYGWSLAHYVLPEVAVCAGLLGVGVLLQRFVPRLAPGVFDGLAALTLLAAITDLGLARAMGTRLDWSVVTLNNSPVMLWRTVKPFLLQAALALGCVGAFYGGLVLLLKRRIEHLPAQGQGRLAQSALLPGLALVLVALAAPHLIEPDKIQGTALVRLAATSPLVHRFKAEKFDAPEFARLARELGLQGSPPVPRPPAGSPRELNFLLIELESTYNQHLSLFGAADETQPLLKKVGSSRVDLQACKLEYSIVSPK